MKYKQEKTFNTKTTAPPGWCLNHVQRGFGAGWAGATATDGWNRTKYKHANDDMPDDVWVPVWFAMRGEPAGHVVAFKKGIGLYSASDNDNAGDFHPTLKHLMDYYGGRLTLRGWSEDLNGTRVVEPVKGDEMVTKIIANVVRRFYTGKDCTEAELKKYVGKVSADSFRKTVMGWPSFENDIASAKAGKLNAVDHLPGTLREVYKAPAPAGAKVLAPGTYQVK